MRQDEGNGAKCSAIKCRLQEPNRSDHQTDSTSTKRTPGANKPTNRHTRVTHHTNHTNGNHKIGIANFYAPGVHKRAHHTKLRTHPNDQYAPMGHRLPTI